MPLITCGPTGSTTQEVFDAINAAVLEAWSAEASKMTADSYATEPEDVFVKIWTSVGDGTFTSADTTEYSALHYATKTSSVPPTSVIGFETKALMDADLNHDAGKVALVQNDPTPANNGSYLKLLATGLGSWQQSSFDRVALVEGYNRRNEEEKKLKASLLVGNNLFNKDTIIPNGYVDDNLNGIFVASTGKGVSDFIPVVAGTYYDFSANLAFASFYDSDLNWVAGGFRNVTTAGITAPTGAAYFKITVNDADLATFMLSVDVTPLTYEAYELNVDPTLLADVNADIAALDAKNHLNDFFDPDLQLTYPYASLFTDTNYLLADFQTRFQLTNKADSYNNYASYIVGIASTVVNLHLGFSKNFLIEKLGYSVGDRIKVGFWFRYPSASTGNSRRIYTGPTLATYDYITTVDDNGWHWHETYLTDSVVTSDTWQGIYLGVRDTTTSAEEFHIRGVTLTNLDTDIWLGERPSTAIADANKQDRVNLNSYVTNIPSALGLYGSIAQLESTYDQLDQPLTKTVVPITSPIVGDCFSFDGTVSTLTRVNFFTALLTNPTGAFSDEFLTPPDYIGKYFSQTMYVRVTADAAFFDINSNNTTTAKGLNAVKFNMPVGQWVKYTTAPILISSRAELEALSPLIQVNCTPTTGLVKVEFCGLTTVLSKTGHCNEVVLSTRADDSIFNSKIYASYGDSITAGGDYPRVPAAIHSMTSSVRGIGGTTVINNGSTAWVDIDGNYLGRPPEAPPSGTEGIDYFTISSGMCTQNRIDTLPADSSLVTIMGGANDWGQNAVIGTIQDAANDTTTSPTFYGAYKSLLDKVQVRCPNAHIVICNITSINSGNNLGTNANGDSVEDFRDAIRTVSKAYGFPVIEMNELGVTAYNHASYSSDGTHPNYKYYEMIGMLLSKKLFDLSYDDIKGV